MSMYYLRNSIIGAIVTVFVILATWFSSCFGQNEDLEQLCTLPPPYLRRACDRYLARSTGVNAGSNGDTTGNSRESSNQHQRKFFVLLNPGNISKMPKFYSFVVCLFVYHWSGWGTHAVSVDKLMDH